MVESTFVVSFLIVSVIISILNGSASNLRILLRSTDETFLTFLTCVFSFSWAEADAAVRTKVVNNTFDNFIACAVLPSLSKYGFCADLENEELFHLFSVQ